MTKTLETADRILKLVLASAVIVCYAFKVITGPFATVLFILATITLVFFVAQIVFGWFVRD